MFSRAVSSGSNPAPSSIIGDITPSTLTLPLVGFITPLTTFNKVLLPAPLLPISPTTSPLEISKETLFKASNSFFSLDTLLFLSNKEINVSLKDVASIPKLNFIVTFLTLIILTSIKHNK